MCNESYWHYTAYDKNKKSWLFWQKQCSEMSNTASVSSIIWSVQWFINNWVRRGAPFCLICILAYSFNNNFWKLCLITVKNAENDQLSLIHCGDSKKKHERRNRVLTKAICLSVPAKPAQVYLSLETLACSSDMHTEKGLSLCSAGVVSTQPFITCATE